jgi:signal peptidase I
VKNFFKDWIVPILVALVIAVLINKFLFFNIVVPTGSMYPTIKPGDRIAVTRIYNLNKLKRQDIIVFYSKELKDTLIKRLIGLPKDEVDIREDGSVYVNGTKLDEPYIMNNGGKTGKYTVPEGQYFFLGDNRSNSKDSRYWEQSSFIEAKEIKGKGRYTLFPFSRFGALK